MPLRTHLLAIAVIIMTVFTGWLLMRALSARNAPPAEVSQNMVEIVRASWGLNCKPGGSGDELKQNLENNYFEAAKRNCKGKGACSFINKDEYAGNTLKQNCKNKELIVEYRCYSFDRLRQLKVVAGQTGRIDCTRVTPPTPGPASVSP